MAGMLPGVESARRRRFHQTGGGGFSDSIGTGTVGSTRRSSFCLYSTNFASHNNTYTFSLRSSSSTTATTTTSHNNIYKDEELGGVAKDAKDRLDERLKAQWKSPHLAKRIDVRSINNGTTGRGKGRGDSSIEEQEEEVIPLKNGPGRRLKWGKSILLGWRLPSNSSSPSSTSEGGEQEEEECVICLEGFKMIGERVMQIACGHRFHSRCLVPWLDANAHCPCCRMPVTPLL